MRRRSAAGHLFLRGVLTLLVAAAPAGCAKTEQAPGLDAGPPPRPLFFQFEGVALGMTPEEEMQVWGTPAENELQYNQLRYANRAGFKEVNLGFAPVGRDPSETTRALFYVGLDPGLDDKDVKPKSAVRSDLVSRMGEPMADAKIYESRHVKREHTEIFRAAECALAIAEWAPAEPDVNWPERLRGLEYHLVPDIIVREVPKAKWNALRGTLPLSPSPETKARYAEFEKAGGEREVKRVLALFGSPNLHLETAPGEGALYYFWLTGSYLKFTMREGKIDTYGFALAYETK